MKSIYVNTHTNLKELSLPIWRSKLLVGLFFIMFASLFFRGLWIQLFNNPFYESQAKKRIEKILTIDSHRGKILDRNNNNLATSLPIVSIFAVLNNDIDKYSGKIPSLAKIINMNKDELNQKLYSKKKGEIFLKKGLTQDEILALKELKMRIIDQRSEEKRYYTQGEVTSQLIGMTDFKNIGLEGLELSNDKTLSGIDGKRKVVKDRLGNTVEELGVMRNAKNGKDLTLSIDSHLQTEVYDALKQATQKHKAKLGTAVVLDAKTGETLAIANWPSYNPNNKGNVSLENMRNHALTDLFEPGSTVKPLIVAAALDKGIVNTNTIINTSSLRVGIKDIVDTHTYPRLNILEVIQKSSNIGVAKIGMSLPKAYMWNFYKQLGIAKVPDINFPGSAKGYLRNYDKWSDLEQATMSYGYGLSASIFQLAQCYTIFANDGKFIPATLFKRDINNAIVSSQVIKPQTAHTILKGLEMVTNEGGTATQAQIEGYRVGGKTGTAHKSISGGYDANSYRAFFVGLAPMSNPRIIVAVMLDDPSNGQHYGGQVAAPVFARVAEVSLRVLNVPMDKKIELKNNK
jgi:cell division protein FtsI (penicillin-binding protein 3)